MPPESFCRCVHHTAPSSPVSEVPYKQCVAYKLLGNNDDYTPLYSTHYGAVLFRRTLFGHP